MSNRIAKLIPAQPQPQPHSQPPPRLTGMLVSYPKNSVRVSTTSTSTMILGLNRIQLNAFRLRSRAVDWRVSYSSELIPTTQPPTPNRARHSNSLYSSVAPLFIYAQALPVNRAFAASSKSGNPIISAKSTCRSSSWADPDADAGDVDSTWGRVCGSTVPIHASGSRPFSIVPGGWSGLNIADASLPATRWIGAEPPGWPVEANWVGLVC